MRKKTICIITLILLLYTSMITTRNPAQSAQTTCSNIEWLDNTTFDSSTNWYNTTGGDLTDVSTSIGNGMANATVVGDHNTYSIVSNPPNSTDWTNVSNPAFPVVPNLGVGFDSAGCWASHEWDETADQTGNTPSVHFKKNVTMPVNMSDYVITSASVSAVVNATVDQNVDVPGDSDPGGSGGSWIADVYDYVRFSVFISDLERVREYEIAYNQTRYLGLGNSEGSSHSMGNTYLIPLPTKLLIYFLTAVLQSDYCNFTITLGIFIYCEDNNDGNDKDTWTMLRIKSFNLTITYEKKIDRSTYVAWNQKGDKLPDPPVNGTLEVDLAILEFKCRIDQSWGSISPNSEIRIIITNQSHTETTKLSIINNTFEVAKAGGFDVTSLIVKDENITVSIQVYLADTFELSTNRTISIDDVSLKITYTIYYESEPGPGPNYLWLIILLCAIIAGILAAWATYQFYLRYPKIIRIIRKTRTNIKKGNETSPLDVEKRGALVRDIQQEQIENIKRQLQRYKPVTIEKGKGGS